MAYLAVASVQRGAALLVLPLFAVALTPQQYGQIATLLTVYALLTVLLSVGLEAPLFRAMFSHDSPETQRIYVSTLVTALFLAPLVVGGVTGLIVSMGPSVLGVKADHLGAYVANAGIFTSATVGPLVLLRAREQFGSYALISLAYAGVQLALRVVLVIVENMGVEGWVLADLIAALFVLALSMRWQRDFLSLSRMRRDDLRNGLRLGLPLLPHFAAHWTLNLSDRLILAAFWGPAVVGIYSVGYQMGLVAALAVTELNRASMPRYGEAVQSTKAREALSEHAMRQIVGTVALTAGASLLGPQVVHLLLPASYSGAASIVPWVALGYAFFGFYCVPMNLLTIVAGKTDGVWPLTLCAAAVNLVANVLFVPYFGPMAAAVNTALGYLLLLVLIGSHARRRCPSLRLDLRPILKVVPLSMAFAGIGSFLSVRPGTTGLAASMGAGALVVLALGFGMRRRPHRVEASLTFTSDIYA